MCCAFLAWGIVEAQIIGSKAGSSCLVSSHTSLRTIHLLQPVVIAGAKISVYFECPLQTPKPKDVCIKLVVLLETKYHH